MPGPREGFEQGTVVTSTFVFKQSTVLIDADSVIAEIYMGVSLQATLTASHQTTGIYTADWQMTMSQVPSEVYVASWQAFKGSNRAVERKVMSVKRTGQNI